jgi:sodium/potassium-transporting ATPase subunit beta
MGRGGTEKNSNDVANATGEKKAPAPVVTQFQFAHKPEELTGWEGFSKFMWNKETSQVMGRTGCSWFKIGLFYLVYYTFLTGYFVAMMLIFYQTLDDHHPKWMGKHGGIIGENPGMGFRPHPAKGNIDSTLIHFRRGDYNGNWQGWHQRLDKYMRNYTDLLKENKKKPMKNSDIVECNFNQPPGPGQICQVNVEELFQGSCKNETEYGFKSGTPCMAVKINKIYDWKPEPYQNWTDLKDAGAPKWLVDYVKEKHEIQDPMAKKMVWISCGGENPADRENLGVINYYPYPGIPDYYYPYQNQEGYISPLVFANLVKPKLGVLIAVSCKAWAANINHDIAERMGTVHFEIMID